jgi:hypothetical protein
METKEQLVNTIREWVKLDNQIKALQKEQSTRKKEKTRLSQQLVDVMKQNEIDCFDIKDGSICYSKTTVKKPITKKILLNILSTYYSDDMDKAVEVNEFILNNREEIIKETIVRKTTKGSSD